MPPSDTEHPNLLRENMPGPRLAVLAEALFLANLMILPGVAFLAIALVWHRHRNHPSPIVRNHLEQALFASLWGGAILIGVPLAGFLIGDVKDPTTWVVTILFFVCFHASLIIGGVIGLNRAILRKPWRFPVLGPDREHHG